MKIYFKVKRNKELNYNSLYENDSEIAASENVSDSKIVLSLTLIFAILLYLSWGFYRE